MSSRWTKCRKKKERFRLALQTIGGYDSGVQTASRPEVIPDEFFGDQNHFDPVPQNPENVPVHADNRPDHDDHGMVNNSEQSEQDESSDEDSFIGDSGGSDASFSSDDDSEEDESLSKKIAKQLALWALLFSISHSSLGALLEVLRVYHPDLPKDPRTLLRTMITKKIAPHVQEVSGGWYYHFGLSECLKRFVNGISHAVTAIKLQINLDGLPVYTSVKSQLWPIQGIAFCPERRGPFIIGMFYGRLKPSDHDFLQPFIDEFLQIKELGLSIGGRILNLSLTSIVCDAPARAFVKNIKPHMAYHCCERCIVAGSHDNRRIHFDRLDDERRSDASFAAQSDPEHHIGPTPMSRLGVGLVSCVVLDYMHLICLGVMRRLVWIWKDGPNHCRLGKAVIDRISANLVALKPQIPSDFARKPRSLHEYKLWKATEWRQFLLYSGPIAIDGCIPEEMFKNFLLLSIGMRILLDERLCQSQVDLAEKFLIGFVRHFMQLYGPSLVSYNVHSVIHLADDARNHGPLDHVSAYPYENNMLPIKNCIRKPSHVLAQVIRRTLEFHAIPYSIQNSVSAKKFVSRHNNGPLTDEVMFANQYAAVQLQKFWLRIRMPDNIVNIGGCAFCILNILDLNAEVWLVCRKVQIGRPSFTYPVPSGIFGIVSIALEDDSNGLSLIKADQIGFKYVVLARRNEFVAFPQLH